MSNAILMALAPVFFVMALGYGAGRLRVVDQDQVDGLNVLVMDFALPASLFVATASASRSQMIDQAPLFAVLGLVMLLLFFAWYFLSRVASEGACLAQDDLIDGILMLFTAIPRVGWRPRSPSKLPPRKAKRFRCGAARQTPEPPALA